ncbi:MAG: DUF2244 domain-containing protein [Gammaproteobacteria bacterium]
MSPRQALGFFAGMCLICLGIATGFAALGLWPVLPFAGLELLALGAALAVVLERNKYREVLWFDREWIRVEFGTLGQRARSHCELPRSRTRAWLEPATASGGTRLVLGYGEQRLVIGNCLTDAERAGLARRLKELIHPAWAEAGSLSGTRSRQA